MKNNKNQSLQLNSTTGKPVAESQSGSPAGPFSAW